jgi:hypothetical protein
MSALRGRLALLQLTLMLRRIHPLAGLAVISLCLAALGGWVWVPQMQTQVMVQRLAVAKARDALKQGVAEAAAPQVPPAQQNMSKFMDTLGDPRHTEQQIKTMLAMAQDTGLELTQAEYKLTCDKASNTCAYRILLPLKGSYGVIRRFSEYLLQAIPFASIDEMNFKREAIADDSVDARLKLTLYLNARHVALTDTAVDEP